MGGLTIPNLAWLAGLLEGEGCFKRTGNAVRIVVQMTDRDVIDRAAGMLGGRVHEVAGRYSHYKHTHRVEICGWHAGAWMMTLYSFLGVRRQAKIRELMPYWRRAHRARGNIAAPRCHPTEPYFARDLCKPCYGRDAQRRRLADPIRRTRYVEYQREYQREYEKRRPRRLRGAQTIGGN